MAQGNMNEVLGVCGLYLLFFFLGNNLSIFNVTSSIYYWPSVALVYARCVYARDDGPNSAGIVCHLEINYYTSEVCAS